MKDEENIIFSKHDVFPVTPSIFQKHSEILDRSPEAMIGVSATGKILYWNPASERLFGYLVTEVQEQDLSGVLGDVLGNHSKLLLNDGAIRPNQTKMPCWVLARDGRKLPVSISVTSLADSDTASVFWLIIRDLSGSKEIEEGQRRINEELDDRVSQRTSDLTESHSAIQAEMNGKMQVEEELNRARAAAEAANEAKSQFIANMSHEMRTPLSAILGYAEMMYDSRQTVTERLSCIGRIRQNIKNLTELVDDILDLSKVESGAAGMCPVTFSLLPELGEILSLLESQAWKKRLNFEVNFEGPIPETVRLDAKRFRQVLVNLIGNAIKFTERGGVYVTVRIGAPVDAHGNRPLTFIITDTGCGIPEEQQPLLFQPFVQGDGSLTRAYGGTGLGLVLSRRVARAMGGDVALTHSQPERGSTFTITLDPGPLDSVTWLDKVDKQQLNVRQPAPLVINHRKLEGMRVLLVEDAADIQILISHFLRRSGAHVEVADNGYEGIKKAQSGRYDLVLMDIQMPVLNGFEATARLHREGFKSPIVALTAHAMKGVREKCLEAGCDDYLTKPINASELINLILRYYNRSKGAGPIAS